MPECAQQSRDKELAAAAAAVDIDVEKVVLVELDFNPSAAVGNQAERIEHLVRAVESLLEADTGAAVQLADDYAFGSVYNEAAALGHHIDVAHENSFVLRAVFLAQAESYMQSNGICRAFFNAFYFAHLRGNEVVGYVFELVFAVVAFYRENFAENCVQTHLPAL